MSVFSLSTVNPYLKLVCAVWTLGTGLPRGQAEKSYRFSLSRLTAHPVDLKLAAAAHI